MALNDVLKARYAVEPGFGVRGQPVALAYCQQEVTDLITVSRDVHPVDDELMMLGSRHLSTVRRAKPNMFDGSVLKFVGLTSNQIVVGQGSYFEMIATCDALLSEWHTAFSHGRLQRPTPARDRADIISKEPLKSGFGRTAAIGVSVVLTMGAATGRFTLVGKRRKDVATDPGLRHVVPSGMLEPSDSVPPLLSTIQRELLEEVGVSMSIEALAKKATLLGIAHDLLRLRPEICVQLDIGQGDMADFDLSAGAAEYSSVDRVPIADLARFIASPSGAELTPAGAGALSLAMQSGIDH